MQITAGRPMKKETDWCRIAKVMDASIQTG